MGKIFEKSQLLTDFKNPGAFLSSPIRFPCLGALLDYKLNSACMHAATASIEKLTVLPICRPIKTIVKRA